MITRPGNVGTRSSAPDFLAPDVQPNCKGVDPGAFFGSDADQKAAARIYCGPCPLRRGCRAWALDQGSDLYGVWGGTTRNERRRIARRRGRAAA
ncbi:WhiB family transcriptional regulator [Micromonospora andamanensis]|uniref:4Fe-4S Wbl-type domain-containing protein n=1 Tax=Micromonospora andamanensis TaxID=1287068 RepID=A0ABQ4HYL7_9ACTN|nr:WhiB family transcriptional regulator [Micromonospora andamanensis]GIJ10768.1 hypothetical protein Van01_39820 [Micromonospora andamanensis]